MLKQQTIKELQQILANNYGYEVNFEEASELGNKLTEFFDILTESIHETGYKERE